jgi:mannose-6-phosphate isomerase-like protein (cupin superfamily)
LTLYINGARASRQRRAARPDVAGAGVPSRHEASTADYRAAGSRAAARHHGDDEAWHVVSGALRFRLGDDEFVVGAGSTVLVPAGIPHTFGNAGPEPSRYIIILTTRLDELIRDLHEASPADRAEIYRRHESELLE